MLRGYFCRRDDSDGLCELLGWEIFRILGGNCLHELRGRILSTCSELVELRELPFWEHLCHTGALGSERLVWSGRLFSSKRERVQ